MTPVNHPPVANNDTVAGTENIAMTLTGLLSNDTDPDIGDTISLSGIVSAPTSGTAVKTGTASVLYTPNPTFC